MKPSPRWSCDTRDSSTLPFSCFSYILRCFSGAHPLGSLGSADIQVSILWAIGFPFPQQHRSTRYVVGTLTQPHTIVRYRATWQGLWPLGIFGSRKSRSYRSVVALCVCLLLLCSCAYPTLQEGELLIIQLFGSCVRSRLLHASIARKQRLSANVSHPKLDDGSRFLKVSHRAGSEVTHWIRSHVISNYATYVQKSHHLFDILLLQHVFPVPTQLHMLQCPFWI